MNIRHITTIILAITIALIALSYALFNGEETPQNIATRQELKPIPNFSFTSTSGENYTIDQFRGKTVILNFWATWCTPCIIEFPKLLKFAKQDPENIILLALSVDEDPNVIDKVFAKASASFKENLQLENVIIGIDSDKSISKDIFGTTTYPETYIITPDMKIKTKIKGAKNWLRPEIKRMVYDY